MSKIKIFSSVLAFLLILSLGWAFSSRARASSALLAVRGPCLPCIVYRGHQNALPTPTAADLPPVPTATNRPPTPIATNRPPVATATPTTKPGSSFTFISLADTKTGTAVLATLSNQAKKLNPAFAIYPGDLVPSGVTTSALNTWKAAMNGGSSNGMFDLTFPVRGNHDYGSTSGWTGFFDTAGVAVRAGATRFSNLTPDLTYAFDYGNARFIGVDVAGDASMITAEEVTWLDNTLTDAESRGLTHAFLFFHGPVYPVSGHTSCPTRTCATPGSVVSLVKVLNKHSIVSAIFNGHEHVQSYVHMDSSRVPELSHSFEEFITGSAGADLYTCSKTFRFDYCGQFDGFAAISVSGRSFTVSTYKINVASPVKTWTFTKP